MGTASELDRYYTVIIFLNIFAMIIMEICIGRSNTLTNKRKNLFRWLYTVIIVAAFCEWMGNLLQGSGADTRVLHIAVKAIELSLSPSIPFLFAWVIDKKHERLINIYLLVHALLECLSGVFGFIYKVDEQSNYSHAACYWIYILAYILAIVYCVMIVIQNVKKYQYNGVGFFLLIVIFMLTGITIQLMDGSLKVDYVALGIAATMTYIFTLEMIQQTDELTELLNRRGYENCLIHMEQLCTIIFFDVDGFKHINDTYGHAFGDEALKKLGRTLRHQYAKYGKCFRYGGDEFCVLLLRGRDRLEQINAEFLEKVEKKRAETPHLPTVSIGYADYDPANQNIQDAVAEADERMYAYKAARKGAYEKVSK